MLREAPLPEGVKGPHAALHDPVTRNTYAVRNGTIISLTPQGTLSTHKLASHPPLLPPTHSHSHNCLKNIEGESILKAQSTIAAVSSGTAVLRAIKSIRQGSHWEWHAPISLQGVKLGICRQVEGQPPQLKVFEFNSSTTRTVTFAVEGTSLVWWVNGSKPKKKGKETISYDNQDNQWYPCASLSGQGTTVAFVPFATFRPTPHFSANNPFSAKHPESAPQLSPVETNQTQWEIKEVRQLAKDKILLVGLDSQVRIIARDPESEQFKFESVSLKDGAVLNLFSEAEYSMIQQWRKDKEIFKNQSAVNIKQIWAWLEYLLGQSNQEPNYESKSSVENILLSKVAQLRPHLSESLHPPNPIPLYPLDTQPYSGALHYFPNHPSPSIDVQTNIYQLEGQILDNTCHYILTTTKTHAFIYSVYGLVPQHTCQINLSQIHQFNKTDQIQQYDQSDIRALKGQGSYLYKILEGCLKRQKSYDHGSTLHLVNNDHLRQLTHDYGIEQSSARKALQHTGNVEEALVWIFTDHKDDESNMVNKKESNQGDNKPSISMVQIEHIFGRLMLQVGNQILLFGLLPEQTRQWVRKEERQYCDLLTFKQEDSVEQLQWGQWFKRVTHPQLHILDNVKGVEESIFLFKEAKSTYVLSSEEGIYYKSLVNFKPSLIYDSNPCLEVEQIQPWQYFVEQQQLVKTTFSELACPQNIETAFSEDTSVMMGEALYTNSTTRTERILEFDLKVKQRPLIEGKKQTTVPVIIKDAPPSCNANYSASAIVTAGDESFLANYPHPISLVHIHHKLMRVKKVTIQRPPIRKNTNYMQAGKVELLTSQGQKAGPYGFMLAEDDQSVQIDIAEEGFVQTIKIIPAFTAVKKLPYEYGKVTVLAQELPISDYKEKQRYQIISQLSQITQNSLSFFVKSFCVNGQETYRVHMVNKELQELQNALNKQHDQAGVSNLRHLTRVKKDEISGDVLSLDNKALLKKLTSKSADLEWILRQMAFSPTFSVSRLAKNEIYKFLDIVLYYESPLLSDTYYSSMFEKLWANPPIKQHILLQTEYMSQPPALPFPYLKCLIREMGAQHHEAVVRSVCQGIKINRNKQYDQLSSNSPYLLLQKNFYSDYYFNLIQPQVKISTSVYSQPVIPTELAVFKSESTRRILVKMPAQSVIYGLAMVVENCETIAKMTYSVLAVQQGRKEVVSRGRVSEQQWIALTKTTEQDQGQSSNNLHSYGIDVALIKAQYLQIELRFSETGLVVHSQQSSRVPQVDIIPQIYGYSTGKVHSLPSIDDLFELNPEEMYLLSSMTVGSQTFQKYSVSKTNKADYTYFKALKQDQAALRNAIQDKITKQDYESIPALQRKLVREGQQKYFGKICLDYLYTLLVLSLGELNKKQAKLDKQMCQQLFEEVIKKSNGPVKLAAFKAITHNVSLVIKSLPYVELEVESLGQLSFSHQQLGKEMDLGDVQLCKALSNLILKVVAYDRPLTHLLIKMSHRTENHSQIIKYFISHGDWLEDETILNYIASLTEHNFNEEFLSAISYSQLCSFVLKPQAKTQIDMLLQVIVQRCSEDNPVDLDVVSLMFQSSQIRWQQLERIILFCPQGADMIINQFLQNQSPELLATFHHTLLITAAQPKYAEQFAVFLTQIYNLSLNSFKEVASILKGHCQTLHHDFIETIGKFLVGSCNFGGVQGGKMLTQSGIESLQAAIFMLKVAQRVPEGEQFLGEENFVDWFLSNNDYELSASNPANKSPAFSLIKQLSGLVLQVLQASTPFTLLNRYLFALNKIKTSRKLSLARKHLAFNQLHHGATQLLTSVLTPGSLAEVLVSGPQPMLTTLIRELKTSLVKKNDQRQKWQGAREVDVTDKLTASNLVCKGDLQAGKGGTKSTIAKISLSQKSIKIQCDEPQALTKLVVGFAINDVADNKTAILPSKVELFAGIGKSSVFKVGELKLLEDQFYLAFGVRTFAINFNALSSSAVGPVKVIQLRLHEPGLASVSEVVENGQRSRKQATFNLSFIHASAYDSLPSDEPDYSQLYVTLLGFLGQPKYTSDLRQVVASQLFDQKLQLIIHVLNDLLPSEEIERLLLSLNKVGQNIFEHLLRSKSANPKLISLLLMGKLTKDNLRKMIAYTLENMTQEYVDIVRMGLRLASYNDPSRQKNKAVGDFSEVQELIQGYLKGGEQGDLYFQLVCSLLTVPNLYNYQVPKVVSYLIAHEKKRELYPLLAAILPYYPTQIDNMLKQGHVENVICEMTDFMLENQSKDSVVLNPHPQMQLLSLLANSEAPANYFVENDAPIKTVNLLKSNNSLLIKYAPETMQLFISFFQSTCIGTKCAEPFSMILIDLMTSLNNFDSSHHAFFINHFFFPLINAFKGVPVLFAWKDHQQHIWQPTQVLNSRPIRSSEQVISHNKKYFAPVDTNTDKIKKTYSLIAKKDTKQVIYVIREGKAVIKESDKRILCTWADGKLTLEVSDDNKVELPHEDYQVYQESSWEQSLLTNTTLSSLANPWIFQEKYRSVLPLKMSTAQRCYFLPIQMKLSELVKYIQINGFTVSSKDVAKVNFTNHLNNGKLTQEQTISDVLKQSESPFIMLSVEAAQLFENTTVQSLAQIKGPVQPFIPQMTIFKTFQEMKGLQKLIGVLTGCIKNWVNGEQSKIWGQYLQQLSSYSCFPIFSSLYMTKETSVGLLFDLLMGLPDRQDSKKWLQRQKQAVKELYAIVKDVFGVEGQQGQVVREYALKSGFYSTMLNRLQMVTKEIVRQKVEEEIIEDDQALPSLERKQTDEDFKTKLVKKKGVGYGTDSSSYQKWDISGQEQARKEQAEQILGLLRILERFLANRDFEYPKELLDETFSSALLPIIESSLRGGSLLQISKYAQLFKGQLSFIEVLAQNKTLIPALLPIPKIYEPKQPQSLHSLLKTLANTAKIFLSCLTGSASEKVSEQIAKKTTSTFELVDKAVSQYQTSHHDDEQDKRILELPLPKKYPLLMKDLRFDYTNMKDSSGKISKHHYSSNYQSSHKSPPEKTVRLAQELADISHALPIDHTNAIFVRCDKERVDFMQALIMGSNGTPYGHGAFLFDIYFDDNYPSGPPKVNLTTTGNGQIRFNPNLYSCGKVCLSLLGTWRGNAMENWDAKVSTLLQVLVSIQSIIMSEDIYFNEPGFQHEQGTPEGEKKNEAYANIVRYGNVKFAMIDNIKNPPKGFETIIRRHFYLKKDQIIEECHKWLRRAQKMEASYNGLISDHNYNWCNNFKKSKNEYRTMLDKAVRELEQELNQLPPPTQQDFHKNESPKKQRVKDSVEKVEGKELTLEEIDMTYGDNQVEQVELDINDERVKDRWSRYIGAMGVEAVSKQSKARILQLGIGAVGVEIAKNLVLSGCKQLAIWDDQPAQWSDLSGQFFLTQQDVTEGKLRLDSTIYKLKELNHYVKVSKFEYSSSDLSNITDFNVVLATERNSAQLEALNQYCRKNNIHFVAVDCYGPYGQIFNDFGDSFLVLDKNGEETVEVMLEDISNAQNGVVKLLKGQTHPYEDGETLRISGVKGMKHKEDETKSLNGTLHKVQVINQNSFKIGNTMDYESYEGDGTTVNLKTPVKMQFKSLKQTRGKGIDPSLAYYDWAKGSKMETLQLCFEALAKFKGTHKALPSAWSEEDSSKLITLIKQRKDDISEEDLSYCKKFSYTCSGTFGPICAFFGGLTAQQIFKAITGKYTPINQTFLVDCSDVSMKTPESIEEITELATKIQQVQDRKTGLRRIVSEQIIQKLQESNVFMVGSGAIGCQLLKNFAMLEVGAGSEGKGSIVVTDPDHIQNSNLNRQFLFREKHLQKPKSGTAAAAVIQMNPRLKGHIKARLDRVSENTKDIYSNQFFQGLSIVANALDNVQARRYVDSRCVQNKVALLQSGTLSSKGHVQVIIPYKTESYGSKQDPNDAGGQVPHCTLKMFPEQTLHCVEWARDLFGKDFTLAPKALSKLLEAKQDFTPGPSDLQMLKDCLKNIQSRPSNFDEAVGVAAKLFYQLYRNDIKQLLYTYPLDAKTKDGKPFWKLPKRPPNPIEELCAEDELHATFISSYAVLLSKIFSIPFPKDFRKPEKRTQIAKNAAGWKVEPFTPSDKLAKEMASEVQSEDTSNNKEVTEEQKVVEEQGEVEIYSKFKEIISELKQGGQEVEAKAQQFEKDEDGNGHIDLIYSMANLRARNYGLAQMEWINVKLKAGRITPALSTTTSCIAALQSVELVKHLKGCDIETMKNAFINLAVPVVQLSEPGQVEKIKIHEELTTNIWQRWMVEVQPAKTIGQFIKAIEDKYKIVVKGLSFLEGTQLYSDIVLSLESKKAEKEKLLARTLAEVVDEELGSETTPQFIDFTLLMAVGEELVKHAPTLRLQLVQ